MSIGSKEAVQFIGDLGKVLFDSAFDSGGLGSGALGPRPLVLDALKDDLGLPKVLDYGPHRARWH
jgi:hypothetical protein